MIDLNNVFRSFYVYVRSFSDYFWKLISKNLEKNHFSLICLFIFTTIYKKSYFTVFSLNRKKGIAKPKFRKNPKSLPDIYRKIESRSFKVSTLISNSFRSSIFARSLYIFSKKISKKKQFFGWYFGNKKFRNFRNKISKKIYI